jgi:hypothetical protein
MADAIDVKDLGEATISTGDRKELRYATPTISTPSKDCKYQIAAG